MQLHLRLILPHPLRIPPGYGHQLQGAIYYALGQKGLGDDAHDRGVPYDYGTFKLLTFGRLHGPHRFQNMQLTFYDALDWEIRSCRQDWMEALADWYSHAGVIKLFDTMLPVEAVSLTNSRILSSKIRIKTETPIFLRKRSQSETGFWFPSPATPEGQTLLSRCFERRYAAFHGCLPRAGVRFSPLSPPEEVLVHYKKAIFPSWNGNFRLEGEAEALSFLFDCGLGSKTSCGLGMFHLL